MRAEKLADIYPWRAKLLSSSSFCLMDVMQHVAVWKSVSLICGASALNFANKAKFSSFLLKYNYLTFRKHKREPKRDPATPRRVKNLQLKIACKGQSPKFCSISISLSNDPAWIRVGKTEARFAQHCRDLWKPDWG
jgi:hypothetical protein